MDFPDKLHYSKDHEWVSSTTGHAKVGVSQFAVEQLGDIVFVELPSVGDTFASGDAFGTIESTKTVSDVYAPCSGKVIEVNEKLNDSPEILQNDPYKDGWLVKLELNTEADSNSLMTSSQYESFIKEN